MEETETDLHFTSIDPTRNRHRFYALRVETDLLGVPIVVRHWGRIGTRGRCRIEACASLEEAEAEMTRLQERRRERGYRLIDPA